MIKRQKTSRARVLSARLNPRNPDSPEAKALEIIERLEQQNYNFKQIAVDAICRAEGCTPEMFSREDETTAALLGALQSQRELMEELIASAVQQLLDSQQRGGKKRAALEDFEEDEDAPAEVSAFARQFAAGYLQRRQQGIGEDDL
jgi:hypothetical protein